MGLFQICWGMRIVKEDWFPSYLELNARVSATLIGWCGHQATCRGVSVSSRETGFSVQIRRGCDAIEPSAIFLAGVAAFPARWRRKLPGMLVGAVLLLALNFVRIVSLFFIGIHYPRVFHLMHVDVWQAVFIFLAIVLWIVWALWATRPETAVQDAAPDAH